MPLALTSRFATLAKFRIARGKCKIRLLQVYVFQPIFTTSIVFDRKRIVEFLENHIGADKPWTGVMSL